MRPIKFRAWDRKAKRMRTVDDLKNLWTLCNHGGDAKTIPNVIAVNQSYRGDDLELIVDKDCDLMQYTELEDKNGKEIYERDIIKCFDGEGVIVFFNACFFIVWLGRKGWVVTALDDERKRAPEVIGNIYENPKLVKESD